MNAVVAAFTLTVWPERLIRTDRSMPARIIVFTILLSFLHPWIFGKLPLTHRFSAIAG
jgi:hypothetical protein